MGSERKTVYSVGEAIAYRETAIERQWLDAVTRLRQRPPTRRGTTIITDAHLDNAETATRAALANGDGG